jgi:hypothetical protein
MEAKNAEEARTAFLEGGIEPPTWVGQGSDQGSQEGLRKDSGSEAVAEGDRESGNRPRIGSTSVSLQIKGKDGFESYRRAVEERFSKTGDQPFRRGDQKDLDYGLTC